MVSKHRAPHFSADTARVLPQPQPSFTANTAQFRRRHGPVLLQTQHNPVSHSSGQCSQWSEPITRIV